MSIVTHQEKSCKSEILHVEFPAATEDASPRVDVASRW
jgi:hypothetical protein